MRELKKYEGNRVILMACSKCNVACKHCYIGYAGNRTPEELKILAEHYKNKYKIVRIDGAEPLVDLGYLPSYKIVEQDWIMTNGLRIFQEPEIIDLLLENGIRNVFMSYHFGIQDSLNGITNEMLNKVIRDLRSINKLDDKDMYIIDGIRHRITQESLAKELKMSKQAVNKRILKISQKIVDFFKKI